MKHTHRMPQHYLRRVADFLDNSPEYDLLERGNCLVSKIVIDAEDGDDVTIHYLGMTDFGGISHRKEVIPIPEEIYK